MRKFLSLAARNRDSKANLRISGLKSIIDQMDAIRIETTVDERGEVHLTKLHSLQGSRLR